MSTPRWEAAADVVVVGTGVAGLTTALRARALGLRVLLISKDEAEASSTRWAQGGVAVVRDGDAGDGDSVRSHVADTMTAGAGLCDQHTVESVVSGGAAAFAELRMRGAMFDAGEGGDLLRTREGGHSAFRVVHAGGDATGAEVERALLASVRDGRLPVLTHHVAVEAVHTVSGAVGGVLVLDGDDVPGLLRARAVVLATGGVGQAYQVTTNPEVATADGLALALRAGAVVSDLEFVQFHPTVLYAADARGSRPLVTEAVRGEGAVLVDTGGTRVMTGVHPLADLAPRDVVSLAVTRRMAETGTDHVLLDATGVPGFSTRFPTVNAACAEAGINPEHDPIPVAPAAHFSCGGVEATVDGRTSVGGLYAVGEVARTGLHGANRLASNSLLEGLVLGDRVARAVALDVRSCQLGYSRISRDAVIPASATLDRATLRPLLTRHAGIGRDEHGLAEAEHEIVSRAVVRPLWTRKLVEDAALTLTARTLLAAARARTESRGAHVRTDYPGADGSWRYSQRLRLDVSGHPILMPANTARSAA